MAFTTCARCRKSISDQAVICPNCGFVRQHDGGVDLSEILCPGTWLVRTGTLGSGLLLVATFSSGHDFQGEMRTDPARQSGSGQMVKSPVFQGRWHVTGSQLTLDFAFTPGDISTAIHLEIQLILAAANTLHGNDQFLRSCEWQKIEEGDLDAALTRLIATSPRRATRDVKSSACTWNLTTTTKDSVLALLRTGAPEERVEFVQSLPPNTYKDFAVRIMPR